MFIDYANKVLLNLKYNLSLLDAFIIVFITIITLVVIVQYIKFRNYVKLTDQIPGPKRSWLVGKLLGTLELFWVIKNVDDFQTLGLQVLIGLTKIYQDCKQGIFSAWIGPFEHVVVLFRSDTIEPLLSSNTHIEKSREYKFFQPWLGLGLLTSTGDHWRSHRKLLTPSFHFRILENFVPVINGQQNIMIDIIEQNMAKNKGIIPDIRPIITNCALDTICETAMGVTINAQTQLDSQYVLALQHVCDLFFRRFVSPWLWPEWLYRLTPSGKGFYKSLQILHKFTNSVVKGRKIEIMKQLADNKNNSLEAIVEGMVGSGGVASEGTKRRLAFLDSLLVHHIRHPQEFTEMDIREEVDTFMFEGHDTTAAAVQFALMLIGHNPDAQTKIHEEMDLIFGDDMTRDITTEDLKQMRYLEQCIKESLRLYPSVPYIARHNNEPFMAGDYLVPKNTTCLVLFYMLHRNPDIYPNPEVFNPDRFDSDGQFGRHPYAYVPFSAGPRNCIGQKFALLEEKALLSAILRRYTIQTLTHRHLIKLDFALILKPNTKISIKFTKKVK